jgi:hypothetical protein
MTPCLPNANWPWSESCHLYADTIDELMAMADLLGLRRSWLQDDPGKLVHFDLTRNKRMQAIRQGAIETDRHHIVARIRAARSSGQQSAFRKPHSAIESP